MVICVYDFSELYTRMTLDEILESWRFLGTVNDPPLPMRMLESLLRLVVENSLLQLNLWDSAVKPLLRQKRGLPMGLQCAPEIVNTSNLVYEVRFFSDKRRTKPLLHVRLIDDGAFLCWESQLSTLQSYIPRIYPSHHSFTMSTGFEVVMLDLELSTVNPSSGYSRVRFVSHVKDREVQPYIRFDSDHPRAMFSGIVRSQLLRLSRNCSTPSDYNRLARISGIVGAQSGVSMTFSASVSRGCTVRKFCSFCAKSLHSRPLCVHGDTVRSCPRS